MTEPRPAKLHLWYFPGRPGAADLWCPLPLVLLLDTTDKSLDPSSPHLPAGLQGCGGAPPEPPPLQAEQPQLLQTLLIAGGLQALQNLGGPALGSPQYAQGSYTGPSTSTRCGLTSSYLWSERMLPTFRYSTVPTTKTEESSVSARHQRKGKKKRALRQSGCRQSPQLTPFCPLEPTRTTHGAWQRRGWIQICASFSPCPMTERNVCPRRCQPGAGLDLSWGFLPWHSHCQHHCGGMQVLLSPHQVSMGQKGGTSTFGVALLACGQGLLMLTFNLILVSSPPEIPLIPLTVLQWAACVG